MYTVFLMFYDFFLDNKVSYKIYFYKVTVITKNLVKHFVASKYLDNNCSTPLFQFNLCHIYPLVKTIVYT